MSEWIGGGTFDYDAWLRALARVGSEINPDLGVRFTDSREVLAAKVEEFFAPILGVVARAPRGVTYADVKKMIAYSKTILGPGGEKLAGAEFDHLTIDDAVAPHPNCKCALPEPPHDGSWSAAFGDHPPPPKATPCTKKTVLDVVNAAVKKVVGQKKNKAEIDIERHVFRHGDAPPTVVFRFHADSVLPRDHWAVVTSDALGAIVDRVGFTCDGSVGGFDRAILDIATDFVVAQFTPVYASHLPKGS